MIVHKKSLDGRLPHTKPDNIYRDRHENSKLHNRSLRDLVNDSEVSVPDLSKNNEMMAIPRLQTV